MPDSGRLTSGLALFLAALWIVFAGWGLDLVPFHPDETSMLYQSRDLEDLFRRPGDLAWAPGKPMTTALEYRLLNAPLAKYLVGAARLLAGHSSGEVSSDWDWSMSWDENVKAGAVPPSGALLAGRTASLIGLTAAALALTAWGVRVGGWKLASLVLLSTLLSSFQLLHGRRAMAEGTLLGAVSLWLYATTHLRSKPWLLGLASGLSIAAKHSTVPLLVVGLLAALIRPYLDEHKPIGAVRSGGVFAVAALAVFLLLNPVLWSHPIGGINEAIRLRSELVSRQNQELAERLEDSTLETPVESLAGAVGLLFVTDLQYQEVGNYRSALEQSISAYESIPGHRLDRGLLAGGLRLVLLGAGLIVAVRTLIAEGQRRPGLAVLIVGAIVQAGALLLFNPLPFQRYYAPLLPFVHALTALAIFLPIARAAESQPDVELLEGAR